ncbi:DUF262 domain-containing protein [Clostridium sp. C8-1-8]|uniref:GmrSD restriction endonuclease domain-containing protein n=1 Tax=Clostridium sp. C8-1-8 TaxID=2698831 RepID=UPI00136F832D|nr:DUF262 domain-containing protein [Clostridium sp. C8-1-8]
MGKKLVNNTNVNLDHHIPSDSLLSASEYQEMPKSEEAQLHLKIYLDLRDFFIDEAGLNVWERLRKPEFQRPTNHWNDEKCINLLKTLRGNQVIPGVIFWLNTKTGHIFVLDGAHRLSVIRAWLIDDWGDTQEAQQYGYVEEDELVAAKRIRESIKNEIGSYKECSVARNEFKKLVNCRLNPVDVLDSETESKGRFAYNLSTSFRIPIQWVTGDYEVAEQSFININMGGTPLSKEEVTYLNNRRSPVSRAIAGIISNGTKETLWIDYKTNCDELSKKLYTTLLYPSDNLSNKVKITEYPLCVLKKQKSFDRYDFLQNLFSVSNYGQTGANNIENILKKYVDEKNNKIVAEETIRQLEGLELMLSHIKGSSSQSLGILPAFYFYTSKGQFKQMLFLLFIAWISQGSKSDIKERKFKFTLIRQRFEEVWMVCKDYVYRSLSRKGAGPSRLTKSHLKVLDELVELLEKDKDTSKNSFDLARKFMENSEYIDKKILKEFISFIEKDDSKPFKKFSEGTKVQQEMCAFFIGVYKCDICGGAIEIGVSHQVDHIEKRSLGGTNSLNNGRIVHPWCNNNRDKIEKNNFKKYSSNKNAFVSDIIADILPDSQNT